jgi:polar amino acid transport system substrate-binding protein
MKRLCYILVITLCFFARPLPTTTYAQIDERPDETILDVLQRLIVTVPNLEGRVIRVATMNTYPPFNNIDNEGRAIGWDYDILDALCGRLNCVPQFIEIAWEGLIPSVSEGINDIAANGITVTEARQEIVTFSEPYITLRQVLIIRINEDRFATVEEFINNDSLTVIALVATTNLTAAESMLGDGNPRIIASDASFEEMIVALIAGEVDAVVMDDLAAQRFVNVTPDAIRLIDEPITDIEELAFIFTIGSDLVHPFNRALAQLRQDGTLLDINTRWLLDG